MIGHLLAALLLSLTALHATATEPKKWQMLTSCRYVEHPSNDGDSFLVNCRGEEFFLRFYFVDAPETDFSFPERTREQWEYFGVSNQALMKAGGLARDFVRRSLEKRSFVIHTRRALAQGRSRSVRYYGLVDLGGRGLHEQLVAEGLARNKGTRVALPAGTRARDHAAALQRLEDQARRERRGAWAGPSS